MSELIVDTGVHQHNIGTKLIEAVEGALLGKHQRVLIADVWRDALPFYMSLGWEPPDAELLRRRLNPRD